MKGFAYLLVAVVGMTGMAVYVAPASGRSEADPIFGIKIPPGYRDWKLISVAHEEGNLNDLRALLGNDLATEAYRDGKLPFPGGSMIARLAWRYVPSEENNKVFGRAQSFVPGAATNVQFMVKDSKKYAATGGLRNSKTVNLPPRRCSKPAFLPRAFQSSRLCLHPLRTLITGRLHEEGRIVSQFDLRRPDQHGGARVIGVHPCGDGIVRSRAG